MATITKINGVAVGGGGGSTMIHNNGGRIQQTTSNYDDTMAMGGSIGFNYYNWSLGIAFNSQLLSLGTPGTTTLVFNQMRYWTSCAFYVPVSGTVRIQGWFNDDIATAMQGANNYFQVWEPTSAWVASNEAGTFDNTDISTLIASATNVTPLTNASSVSLPFESTNGITVNAGTWLFATFCSDAVPTATEYRVINYRVFIDT